MVCGVTITSLNIAEIFWAVVFLNTMYSGLVSCSLRQLRPLIAIRLISMKIFSSTTPSYRTTFYGKTFFVSIVNSYSRLPVEVMCSASMDIFKKTCFMFLVGGAEDEQE
jgi:hypothetical protein